MGWNNAGSVAVTQNSRTIIGTGTTFSTSAAGSWLWIRGETRPHEIASVDTDLQITTVDPIEMASAADLEYRIIPVQGLNLVVRDRIDALIDSFDAQKAALALASAAALWVSGAAYAAGDLSASTVDFMTYRAITAHAGESTDPANDPVNWVGAFSSVSGDFSVGGDLAVAGSGAFAGSVTVSGGSANLLLQESDTLTEARVIVSAGDLFIQAGAEGAGGGTSAGNIRFSGRNNANVDQFTVRIGGVNHDIIHGGGGQSISGELTISGINPRLRLNDTSANADDFFVYADIDSFYILTDRDDSGVWEGPHPLQLRNSDGVGFLYGQQIIDAGGGQTISGTLGVGDPTSNAHAANKLYVDTAIAALVDSSPGALDTLNELAAALGDDPNFATTVNNNIATKLPLAGGELTGSLGIGGMPVELFHIFGSEGQVAMPAQGRQLHVGRSVNTEAAIIELGISRTGDGFAILDFHGSNGVDFNTRLVQSGGDNGSFEMRHAGTGALILRNTGAAQMLFETNSVQRMRIDGNGTVAIGNPTAAYGDLHIAGALPIITLADTDDVNTGRSITSIVYGSDLFRIQTRNSTNGFVAEDYLITKGDAGATFHNWLIENSSTMRLNSTGLALGDGGGASELLHVRGAKGQFAVTVDGRKIHVGRAVATESVLIELGIARTDSGDAIFDMHASAGVDYSSRIIRNSGVNGSVEFTQTGTGGMRFRNLAAGSMSFETDNVQRMRLSQTGRLGLGVTDPDNYFGTSHIFAAQENQDAATRMSVANTTVGPNAIAMFQIIGGSPSSWQALDVWDNDGSPIARHQVGIGVGALEWIVGGASRMLLDATTGVLEVIGDTIRIATAKTPASSSASGTEGDVCRDDNYIYVCTAANTWKRAALSSW